MTLKQLLLRLFFIAHCSIAIGSVAFAANSLDTLFVTGKDIYPLEQHLYWMQTDQRIQANAAFQLLQNGVGRLLAPERSINSEYTNNFFWLSFTLKNISPTRQQLFYQFNNPYLNNIAIYQQYPGGFKKIISTGAILPFSTREYPYHDFVLPIQLDAGQAATYLIMTEKRGEIFSTKPVLMSGALFKKKEQTLYTVFGVIMGIMIFNILINLFLGISLADKIHYLYAAYVCAALAWLFSSTGTDFQFLFPNNPVLFSISQAVTGAVTVILMAQLAIVFLHLKETNTKSFLFLNMAQWLMIVVLPFRMTVYVWFPHPEWLRQLIATLYILAVAGISVGMVWTAIVRVRQGFKPAWFYLAAIAYLAFSIFKTCFIILGSGEIAELVSPPNDVQQGIVIETIIIFAGIIYRYNLFKKEKKALYLRLDEQRQEMTRRIVGAQEEERKRLAQDLHDDLGATLSTLLLHITNLPEVPEWQKKYNERSIAISQKALSDLRHISHDLLPKDFASLGLFRVLTNRIDELNSIGDVRFGLNTYGNDNLLDEIRSVTLYRIANELINNTVKHAKASHADLDITINDKAVTLIAEDDGIGFSNTDFKNGIGMKNVQSRVAFLNGSMNIDNNKQGTTIIIDIPL